MSRNFLLLYLNQLLFLNVLVNILGSVSQSVFASEVISLCIYKTFIKGQLKLLLQQSHVSLLHIVKVFKRYFTCSFVTPTTIRCAYVVDSWIKKPKEK